MNLAVFFDFLGTGEYQLGDLKNKVSSVLSFGVDVLRNIAYLVILFPVVVRVVCRDVDIYSYLVLNFDSIKSKRPRGKRRDVAELFTTSLMSICPDIDEARVILLSHIVKKSSIWFPRRLETREYISLPQLHLEKYIYATPTREILDGIIAEVLGDLGFDVKINARMESRVGEPIEVDVYATRYAGDTKFSVCVSCKNWNRIIGGKIVDEEIGRVSNLKDVSQLKVIVVRELAELARKSALANGFMVIELEEKVDTQSALEIYKQIYKVFHELFHK